MIRTQVDDIVRHMRVLGEKSVQIATQQQSTAVEQVATAASDTARVSRETEAGAVQTRPTAAHLAVLSTDVQKLVGGYPRP